MNTRKSVLLRAMAVVCFFGFFTARSQNSDIKIWVDLMKKEIVTYVTLSEIPPDVDIVWQQKVPRDAHYVFSSQGKQSTDKVIILSFSKFLFNSTLTFNFTCKMDYIEERIMWGESTLTYVDAESKKQVVNFAAKKYVVADCLMNPYRMEQTASANDTTNTIIVKVSEDVKKTANPVNENTEIAKNEGKTTTNVAEKPVEKPIERIVEKPVEKPKEEPLFVEKPKENKVAETTRTPQLLGVATPKQSIALNMEQQESVWKTTAEKPVSEVSTKEKVVVPVENKTTPPANSQNTEVSEGNFYIQLFALKNRRTIADIKTLVRLMKEDTVVEIQRENNMYVYLVGSFSSKKEASTKLEYYKKYAQGSFITKL